ncbi:MAG TPA: GNAT family N-acetyltransferase [Gammaproteobacteria bacterium]
MDIRVVDSIDHVSETAWNALHDNRNPFVRHEFLAALEHHHCVGGDTGWLPKFILARENERLAGAIPMYLKYHSMGEFVFDWAWASAYARSGLNYYPKLVVAIPYTPVTGPRLLLTDNPQRDDIANILIEYALEYARTSKISSMHWLFTNNEDVQRLKQHGLMMRTDCQFHWKNSGYGCFDDFLGQLSSHKRKKVKRERRFIQEQGIHCQILTGSEISASHLDTFYGFYQSTFHKKGHTAPLTPGFFRALGETLPDNIILIMAYHNQHCVAGALFLRGTDTLYGRYWGCIEEFHSLHFELCYYLAIDYCITVGLEYLEAGAQGEHKLVRGFFPEQTHSLHWIAHPAFRQAIQNYLEHEQHQIEHYMNETEKHLPYKQLHYDNDHKGG